RSALAPAHDVSVLEGDPRDRATAARATAEVDAVICATPDPGPDHQDALLALDAASRGIFNLLTTAQSAGATRFVLLSTLRLFERYPLDYAVTEYWAPRPTTQPEDLVPFVAEAVVREASHALPITAVCLRLATVSDGADDREDTRAVHVDDAVQAV